MKIQILVDNLSENSALKAEWGLSVYIEFENHKILLDTGASKAFSENAKTLGVNLSEVDTGILSHAHYDHAGGLEVFFKENQKAKFYLQKSTAENCYHTHKIFGPLAYHRYIGIPKGCLKKFSPRFATATNKQEILPHVYLLSHSTENLSAIAEKVGLSVKEKGKYKADNFSHEQSLIFETEKGLFIMNSCSHAGADNIIKEVEAAFKNKPIYGILGGFHLYRYSDKEIFAFAKRLQELNVQKVYTGHCTGEHAFKILKETLGEKVEQMFTGMEITH